MASKHSLPDPDTASDPALDSAKRRKTGIDSKWKADFPWLQLKEDDQGMLCKLFYKLGRHPQKAIIGCAVYAHANLLLGRTWSSRTGSNTYSQCIIP